MSWCYLFEIPLPFTRTIFCWWCFDQKTFGKCYLNSNLAQDFYITVALVICGLFICKFTYSQSKNVNQTSRYTVFPSLIRGFLMELGIKLDQNWSFLASQCSPVICGFIICDSLPERIYRELRGPPVLSNLCSATTLGTPK